MTSAILGAFAFVPGVILSIRADLWVIVAVDTLALGTALALLLAPRISYATRAIGVIIIAYALSVMLIYFVTMPGAGLVWFIAFPVLAALLLGMRAARRRDCHLRRDLHGIRRRALAGLVEVVRGAASKRG